MNFILSLIFVLGFVSRVYAGAFDDVLKSAAGKAVETITSSVEQKNSSAQKNSVASIAVGARAISLDYIKVEKGSYGLPLGANLDTFLIWCKDKNINIEMMSEEEFIEDLKRKVFAAKMDDNLSVEEIEKAVDARLAGGNLDTFEKMGMLLIKERINILKGPSFNYLDKKYFMMPLFLDDSQTRNGIAYSVPGEERLRLCSTDGIIKNSFAVILSPSQEMKDGGVSMMGVFFMQKDQQLKTYAVITQYFSSDRVKQQNQWTLISDTLTKKYQAPLKVNPVSSTVGAVTPEETRAEEVENARRAPLNQDAGYLFGMYAQEIESQVYYMFGRNIVLTGSEPLHRADWESPIHVFYVDADLGKEVLQIRTGAVKSCRDQAIVEKQQQIESAADNI